MQHSTLLVPQLTRYYDTLLEHKPFQQQVDYRQPIRLIGIAPAIHNHNLVDRKYNSLPIELLEFESVKFGKDLSFQLKDRDANNVSKLTIPYFEGNSFENISIVPKELLNLLAKGDSDTKNLLLKIRSKILKFDKRIKEIINLKTISYGMNKDKLCAEIYFDDSEWMRTMLTLWLPFPNGDNKKIVDKLDIFIDRNNFFSISPYGDVKNYTKAIGFRPTYQPQEWLIDLALEKWLERL